MVRSLTPPSNQTEVSRLPSSENPTALPSVLSGWATAPYALVEFHTQIVPYSDAQASCSPVGESAIGAENSVVGSSVLISSITSAVTSHNFITQPVPDASRLPSF